MSFVVTHCTACCHLLSLVVPLVVIRGHSLPFFVTFCTTRFDSFSLFINDQLVTTVVSVSYVIKTITLTKRLLWHRNSNHCLSHKRNVFRTQLSIYGATFSLKYLSTKSRWLFSTPLHSTLINFEAIAASLLISCYM